MYKFENLKELMEYIDLNETLLSNYRKNHNEIIKFLQNQGKPAGYIKCTSYFDADCIHGSRRELHPDQLQAILDEKEKLESLIYLQEEILKNLYDSKKKLIDKINSLDGLEYKIAVKRYVEGKTQVQTAEELDISDRHVRRIEANIK